MSKQSLLLLALMALIFSASPALVAQDGEAKPAKLDEIKSPDFIDYADLIPPTKSFEYWLDTIRMDDAEFKKLIIAEYESYHAVEDERVKNAKEYVEKLDLNGLRKERERRLDASFDFAARIDRLITNTLGGNALSPEERAHKKRAIIDTQLSETTRLAYDKRNIRAIKEFGTPDYKAGTAQILVRMYNIVSETTETYVMFLNLYPKGLMWRWYYSRHLPYKDDAGTVIEDPFASVEEAPVEGATADSSETEKLDLKIKALERQLAEHQAVDVERAAAKAELQHNLRDMQETRNELARERNPYGSVEMAWATAKRAYDKGDWDTFIASHSKRVRNHAAEDAEAKKRFTDAAAARTLTQLNKQIIMDPDDADKAQIKVTWQVNYQRKTAWKDNPETLKPSDINREQGEKQVKLINLVREGGKWLIDSDL